MYKGIYQKSPAIVINGCNNSVDYSPLKSVKHYFISQTFFFRYTIQLRHQCIGIVII